MNQAVTEEYQQPDNGPLRFDWRTGEIEALFELPFNDGESDDQFTFGIDAILTY